MRPRSTRTVLGGILAVVVSGVMACAGSGASSPGAQSGQFNAKEYFSGKTIRVVTSSSPGGGTDAKARVLGSRLSEFIPGNPNVQVSNVTPHVAGINYIWNAPNDGTVIGVLASSPMEFELFEGAKWNSTKFRYLGSVDSQCGSVLLMRGNLGYESIEDVRGSDSPALVTMTQAPDPASIEPMAVGTMLAADWLDLPLKVNRVAESGTSALKLALQRDQINMARFGADWCRLPQSSPGWLEDQFVVPILDMDPTGSAQVPSVIEEKGMRPPHVSKLLTEEQLDQWKGMVASRRAGGNPIMLPPGTPDNVTKALRRAWSKAAENREFRDAMVKAFGGADLKWRPAGEYTQLVQENRKALYRWDDEIDTITDELYNKYVR